MSTGRQSPFEILSIGEPEMLPARGDGVRFYMAVCGVALAVVALPLLARGVGLWSLFPPLVGAVAVAARWRSGPVLVLGALLWLVLADRVGCSPWWMVQLVVDSLAALFAGVFLRAPPRDFFLPRLQDASLLLDILLAGAVVAYTAAHYRLVSLTGTIFPSDRRQRPRKEGKGSKVAPVLPQRRGAHLVAAEEVGPLLFGAVLCACFGQFLWLWLGERYAGGDLYEYARVQVGINIPNGAWRLFVLVWLVSLVLLPLTGVLAYLGQRHMTPEEAALYLQDQLWRQTRREQARIGRWLAWQTRRQRARAARKEKS